MNRLVHGYLEHRISRRAFGRSLAALGITAAGVRSICQASEAVAQGTGTGARQFTGTGGELMVAQMKAAGVRYLFTNPGSFEVGFFSMPSWASRGCN